MLSSNQSLSIDTNLPIYSSIDSNITATTQITITPSISRLESIDSNFLSGHSIFGDVEIIKKTNERVCSAVRKRIEEQKQAISQMEISELKKEVHSLREIVENLQKNSILPEEKPKIMNYECISQCPSIAKHSILILKEKLKQAKRKNKTIKLHQDLQQYEHAKLNNIAPEKSSETLASLSYCKIF